MKLSEKQSELVYSRLEDDEIIIDIALYDDLKTKERMSMVEKVCLMFIALVIGTAFELVSQSSMRSFPFVLTSVLFLILIASLRGFEKDRGSLFVLTSGRAMHLHGEQIKTIARVPSEVVKLENDMDTVIIHTRNSQIPVLMWKTERADVVLEKLKVHLIPKQSEEP